MDEDGETTLNVASTTDQITLQPGELKFLVIRLQQHYQIQFLKTQN